MAVNYYKVELEETGITKFVATSAKSCLVATTGGLTPNAFYYQNAYVKTEGEPLQSISKEDFITNFFEIVEDVEPIETI